MSRSRTTSKAITLGHACRHFFMLKSEVPELHSGNNNNERWRASCGVPFGYGVAQSLAGTSSTGLAGVVPRLTAVSRLATAVARRDNPRWWFPTDRLRRVGREREKASPSGSVHSEGEPTRGATRGGFSGWTRWSEEEHTKTDIRECTDQHCMNVEVNCGFQGLDPGSPLSQSAGVSDDLRAAWRTKLAGEGKPSGGTRSVRDIVFGPGT